MEHSAVDLPKGRNTIGGLALSPVPLITGTPYSLPDMRSPQHQCVASPPSASLNAVVPPAPPLSMAAESVSNQSNPTAAVEPTIPSLLVADPREAVDADFFPEIGTMSAAFFYRFIPRPITPTAPEYLFLQRPAERRGGMTLAFDGFLSKWNLAWEADHLRGDMVREAEWEEVAHISELARLRQIVDQARVPDDEPDSGRPTANLFLIPQIGRSRFAAYGALYRLLPRRTLDRFGLPPLQRGMWPTALMGRRDIALLPPDVETRLAYAFAHHVWPLLACGARPDSLADDEPVRLLAHNLDFWFPYLDRIIESRLAAYGPVEPDENSPPERLLELQSQLPPGYIATRPLRGGSAWWGEAEAWEATHEMVELADADGRLRGLIDAVRAHRVEEDFSPRWSWAREDFERRLYKKRNKVAVRFIELPDTLPVHGPASEYGAVTADGIHTAAAENLLWEDFLALLDPKERRIVVCLRSGATRLGDVAQALGYANHSPVSKALSRIRRKASHLLNE